MNRISSNVAGVSITFPKAQSNLPSTDWFSAWQRQDYRLIIIIPDDLGAEHANFCWLCQVSGLSNNLVRCPTKFYRIVAMAVLILGDI